MEHPTLEQMLNRATVFGAYANSVFEDMGIDVDSLFKEAFERYSAIEPFNAYPMAMNDVLTEIVKKAPMWMRFNIFSHKLSNAKEKGLEDKINWDVVNSMLEENRNLYDFNAYDRIESLDDFYFASAQNRTGSFIGSWQKNTCKTCGEMFYMSKGEVDFFAKNNLHLPKRCLRCRKPEKYKKEEVMVNTIIPQEDIPTAMELALMKAGLVDKAQEER